MRGLYESINSLCYNIAPVGADYDKGYDVGDQALGNLHAGGRVTVCQVRVRIHLSLFVTSRLKKDFPEKIDCDAIQVHKTGPRANPGTWIQK
jgi:hypothetical protein